MRRETAAAISDNRTLVLSSHHLHREYFMQPNYTSIKVIALRAALVATLALGASLTINVRAQATPPADGALRAFEVVRSVLQSPRCRNCHIPGNAPLQGDESVEHDQNVVRGPTGRGATGNECSSCHLYESLPASYGVNAPPGSPTWRLPSPKNKMVFIGLSPHALCLSIKDIQSTGGRDLPAMLAHIRDNRQVAWGWKPGGTRTLPPASRAATVAAFKTWMDAGAPCP
jgi:hypothetical protein